MKFTQLSTGLAGRGANLAAKALEIRPELAAYEFQFEASTHLDVVGPEVYNGSTINNTARAEGSPVNERNRAVPTVNVATHKLYEGEIAIDNLRLQDKKAGLMTPQAMTNLEDTQLVMETRRVAMNFADDVFAGDGTSNRVIGLSAVIADADASGQTARFGFTADELAAMLVQVNLKLDSDDNIKQFLELLQLQLNLMPGANAIHANANLHARLTSVARAKGFYSQGQDFFNQTVDKIHNIPFVKHQTSAIPMTESNGDSNTCTSMYIVNWQEYTGCNIPTNTGLLFEDFPQTTEESSGVARVGFYGRPRIQSRFCLRRMSRIQL